MYIWWDNFLLMDYKREVKLLSLWTTSHKKDRDTDGGIIVCLWTTSYKEDSGTDGGVTVLLWTT